MIKGVHSTRLLGFKDTNTVVLMKKTKSQKTTHVFKKKQNYIFEEKSDNVRRSSFCWV